MSWRRERKPRLGGCGHERTARSDFVAIVSAVRSELPSWPNSPQSARDCAPHRFPQRVASSPNGFNVVHAATGVRELLSEFTNVHVDDLGLGLFHVHVAIEIIEERLLGQS